MLVAILTANVGTEVGAFMLQHMVGKFNVQFNKFHERYEDNEERDVAIDNLLGTQHITIILLTLCPLYCSDNLLPLQLAHRPVLADV